MNCKEGELTQNLRRRKKGFSGLKKIKIRVFATVTLLFHLKHHKALVYLTRHFSVLPSHPKRTVVMMKAMTAAVNICLKSWYLHVHCLVKSGNFPSTHHRAVKKSSATRPPSFCPRQPRASPAQGARPGWWTGSSCPPLRRRSNLSRSAPPSHSGQRSSRGDQRAARTWEGQGTAHGDVSMDVINLGEEI